MKFDIFSNIAYAPIVHNDKQEQYLPCIFKETFQYNTTQVKRLYIRNAEL